MIEPIGRPARPSVADERELVRARLVPHDSPPIARCHPDRPMYAVGLCQHCYAEVVRHRQRTADAQLRGDPLRALGAALSPREAELIELIAAGHTNGTAAAEVGISAQTVKNHMSSILRKLGAESAAHAVALHLESKYSALDETVAALEYLGHVERNLIRLRRDVTGVIGEIRKARTAAAGPIALSRLELVEDPQLGRIVRNRVRDRGTSCKRGHPFTEANTRISKRGGRQCRTCARDKARAVGQAARDALRRVREEAAA